MGLLKSVIADARPARSVNGPSAITGRADSRIGSSQPGATAAVDTSPGLSGPGGRQTLSKRQPVSTARQKRHAETVYGPDFNGLASNSVNQSRDSIAATFDHDGGGVDRASTFNEIRPGLATASDPENQKPLNETIAAKAGFLPETRTSKPAATMIAPAQHHAGPDRHSESADVLALSTANQPEVDRDNAGTDVRLETAMAKATHFSGHQDPAETADGRFKDAVSASENQGIARPTTAKTITSTDVMSTQDQVSNAEKAAHAAESRSTDTNHPREANRPARSTASVAYSDVEKHGDYARNTATQINDMTDTRRSSGQVNQPSPAQRVKAISEDRMAREQAALSATSASTATAQNDHPGPDAVTRPELDAVVSGLAGQARMATVQARPGKSMAQPVVADRGQPGRAPVIEVSRTPEVRIGRVDVFVETKNQTRSRANAHSRPSPALASRHYLRRL